MPPGHRPLKPIPDFWGRKGSRVVTGKVFLRKVSLPVFLLACSLFAQTIEESGGTRLQPREQFFLDLPKISVTQDEETGEFTGVSTTFPESSDRVIIGMGDDEAIRETSHGLEKTIYRESPEKAGYLSKFEGKSIMAVNKKFMKALEVLDKLLQNNNWNRCRYLDAYFPHFLNGYYYLIDASCNSLAALPRSCRVSHEEYDVSLSSLKTDLRVQGWISAPGVAADLRSAGIALGRQLKTFQKVIDKTRDHEELLIPEEFKTAYAVFIRCYFNRSGTFGAAVVKTP